MTGSTDKPQDITTSKPCKTSLKDPSNTHQCRDTPTSLVYAASYRNPSSVAASQHEGKISLVPWCLTGEETGVPACQLGPVTP